MLHKIISLLISFSIFSAVRAQNLVINEIMQSNIDAVMIENDFPDSWCEIYNTTNSKISLGNYYLGKSNNFSSAFKLSGSIPANAYSVIYCDKKGSGNHTNFRIESADNGSLYLFYKTGKVIDSLSFSAMPAPNIAYGRTEDAGTTWQYEINSTPGTTNGGIFSDLLLGSPIFSIPGQLMTSNAELTISIPEGNWPEDTRIFLTTDGSEPTRESVSDTIFHFTIDSNLVVRAVLMSDYALSPRSTSHSYIFLERPVTYPVISILLDSRYLYDKEMGIFKNYSEEWRRPINIECFDPYKGLLFNQVSETAVGGHGSRWLAQKSMKCYANKRFGTKRFFGQLWEEKENVTECKSILLRSGGNRSRDSRINDAIGQRIFGSHLNNIDYQAYKPVLVYINGIYKGLYELRERANEDYVAANYDGLEEIITKTHYHYKTSNVSGKFKEFRDLYLQENSTFEDLSAYMDIDNFLKSLIAEVYAANTDYPHNNVFMWRPSAENGKWRWILKDLDAMSMSSNIFSRMFDFNFYGTAKDGTPEYKDGKATTLAYNTLYRKMILLPEFRHLFITHYAVYLGDFLKPTVTLKIMNQMYKEIEDEIVPTINVYNYNIKDFNGWKVKLRNFIKNRQKTEYPKLASFFSLGTVIPMTIENNGHEIQIDSISLIEGDFDGAWFSDYPLSVQTGAHNYGWRMKVFSSDTTVYEFGRPNISLTLNEYGVMDSVRFEPIQLDISEFEQKIADLGIESCDLHNFSEVSEVILPEPSCAYANITGIDELPIDKTDYKHAYIDFYDNEGNYFRKKVILAVQGKSTDQLKKNLSISFCEDEWVGSETPDIYFGDWVKQDEFHLKAFYNDYFRGIPAIGYKLYNQMVLTYSSKPYAWERGLTESDLSNPDLKIFNNARCFPDAFPCVIYFNGDYYGTFAWQLKKQRRNMNLTKNVATHIHLDGTLNDKQLFKGNVNWTKFEVRNPKDLYNMDGTNYDGDNPQELIDATSSAFINKKKMLRCAEVKQHILDLSNYYSEIANLISSGASDDDVRAAIDARFDITSLVDYMILSLVTSNYKGFSKNWQWFTYDGIKWFVTPYDLDLTFGYNEEGNDLWPAFKSSKNYDYKMENVDSSGPMLWIKNYYWDDLKARYAELRQQGVLSTSNIMSIVKDWYSRIGNDNYNEEYLRWPQSPCVSNFSDGLDRIEQWITERITLEDSYLGYEVDSASYSLAVTELEWATVCVPFAFDIPAGMEVYTVRDIEEDSLSLVYDKQEVTVANNPYLVHAPESTYLLTGEYVDSTSDDTNMYLENGLLTGTYSSIFAPQDSYVLQSINGVTGFYRVLLDNYLSVPANHAYLTIPNAQSQALYRLPGENAAIDIVNKDSSSYRYFDISGRRINKPSGGLYFMHSNEGVVQKIYKK